MYNRVLVLLDGSGPAEQILPFAGQIARDTGASIQLLSVVESDLESRMVTATRGRYVEDPRNAAVAMAEEYLREVAQRLEVSAELVSSGVLVGRVVDEIQHEAKRVSSTLLAMTTHGRAGLWRLTLGSVATKLVQSAQSPILLLRPGSRDLDLCGEDLSTVIVPLDGSQLAEAALPHASSLARALDCSVVLTSVAPSQASLAVTYGASGRYYVPPGAVGRVRSALQEYLEAKAQELTGQGVNSVRVQFMQGDAAKRILALAKADPGSLVVISTHGRSGLGRWVMGSVADKVMRQSVRPVLVIRPAA